MSKKSLRKEIIGLGNWLIEVNNSIAEAIKFGDELVLTYAADSNQSTDKIQKVLKELNQIIIRNAGIHKELARKVSPNTISELKRNLPLLKSKSREAINLFVDLIPLSQLSKEELIAIDVLKNNIAIINTNVDLLYGIINSIEQIQKENSRSSNNNGFLNSFFSIFTTSTPKKKSTTEDKYKLHPIFVKSEQVGYVQGSKIFDKKATFPIGFVISDKIYDKSQSYPIGYIQGDKIYGKKQDFPIGYVRGDKIFDKKQDFPIGFVMNRDILKGAAAFFVIQGKIS